MIFLERGALMGLFDKIKDLFTDEEEIIEDENAVKIKEIKKEDKKKEKINDDIEKTEEHKLPTFMRNKILEDEQEKSDIEKKIEEEKEIPSSRVGTRKNNNLYIENTVELPKNEINSFKFPIEINDSDFDQSDSNKITVSSNLVREISNKDFDSNIDKTRVSKNSNKHEEKKVSEIYKDKKDKVEGRKFRVSPIISPIYGILDKNYSKDEVKEIDSSSYEIRRSSTTKGIDFDTVRKKAYGNLVDDIKDNLMCENCEYNKEKVKDNKKTRSNDNLVYDILSDDEETEKEDITFGTVTENYYDYGVEYESDTTKKNYRKKEETEEVKIVNNGNEVKEEKKKKDIPPVKSNINLLSTLKKSMGEDSAEVTEEKDDLELTDDLFNMIDSMYDERNDD